MSTTRIFATVEAFRLACPICTQITVIKPEGPARRRKGGRRHGTYAWTRMRWDPRHQVLRCAWCNATWQIGLVVRPQAVRRRRERPTDIVPTKQELGRLRNLYGGGWWVNEPHTGDAPVNLYVPEECSCAPDPWKASCPVHGREGAYN